MSIIYLIDTETKRDHMLETLGNIICIILHSPTLCFAVVVNLIIWPVALIATWNDEPEGWTGDY